MSAQEFAVPDVVRLQIQQGWPDLPNLILNPSGEGGAWDWFVLDTVGSGSVGTSDYIAVSAGSSGLTARAKVDLPALEGGGAYYRVPVEVVTGAGKQVRAAVDVGLLTAPTGAEGLAVVFRDADDQDISGVSVPITTTGVVTLPATDVPVGTAYVYFVVASSDQTSAWRVRYDDAWLIFGDAASVAASDPLTDPDWTDVLGSAAQIQVERDELSVSVLTAKLLDATLDPAATDLIRPGKRCRLETEVDGVWEPLFTGKLDDPSTAYVVGDPDRPEAKRVEVNIVASDAAADLANDVRPEGVATIAELPYVLLGTGVPFNVNGSDDAIAPDSVTVVAVNEQAKAIDQVAITRDSVLGYAWVDRAGVLQAWDADQIGTTTAATINDAAVSDLTADFDIARTFNTIKVTLAQINPGTGETEEIEFGPYVDTAARREWRAREAGFKVQGLDRAAIDAYAAEILARNATPEKRINSATLPIRTVAELEAHALLDLYDLVSLSSDRADVIDQLSRIATLKHRIVIKKEGGRLVNRWWVDLGFTTDGSVAAPQVTPSPAPGGGKTLAELLRPIGEVTMWYGAKADIPAGWLPLDGSAFDAAQYPALATLLGGAVLPNMTDRFPIGAGTKALGTSGGSPVLDLDGITTTDPADSMGWSNTDDGASSVPRLADYNGHTHELSGEVSVMNPWRSLWFLIRAA